MSRKIEIEKLELAELYNNPDLSIADIAKYFGCTMCTIFKRLKEFNIYRDRKKDTHKLDSLTKSKLKQLYYVNELSVPIIAKRFHCAKSSVYKKMYKFGFLRRSPKEATRLCNPRGPTNRAYKDGSSSLGQSIKSISEYKQWRRLVFERDHFTCQECFVKAGGYLEAHHLEHFGKLLSAFLKKYDQFSVWEDKETLIRLAIKYKSFWNLENGKTLCKKCHKEEHRFKINYKS